MAGGTSGGFIRLAFVSPRIVEAIANGSAPADLTVTSLTSALPHSWTSQEKKYGVVCPVEGRDPEMMQTDPAGRVVNSPIEVDRLTNLGSESQASRQSPFSSGFNALDELPPQRGNRHQRRARTAALRNG